MWTLHQPLTTTQCVCAREKHIHTGNTLCWMRTHIFTQHPAAQEGQLTQEGAASADKERVTPALIHHQSPRPIYRADLFPSQGVNTLWGDRTALKNTTVMSLSFTHQLHGDKARRRGETDGARAESQNLGNPLSSLSKCLNPSSYTSTSRCFTDSKDRVLDTWRMLRLRMLSLIVSWGEK